MLNKSNFSVETAAANHGEAMEQRNHFKNGDSPKTHSIRANFIVAVCFALLAVFSGCDKNKNDSKSIDKALIGKWALQTVVIDGTYYSPPFPNWLEYLMVGLEFTTSTCKIHSRDGSLEELKGVYSKSDQLYYSSGEKFEYTWGISEDDELIIWFIDGNRSYYQKVTKFSWE